MRNKFMAVITFLVLLPFFVFGQNFVGQVDGKKVFQNSTVNIEYKLNSDGAQFQAPNFTPFQVVRGPSTSTSMQIINGRMSKSISYSFSLITDKIGKFTLPPASIQVGGKRIQSNRITIEVVKAKDRKPGEKSDEDYFVEIQISDDDIYLGQQLVVDYKLYTTEDVRSFNIINESEYEGFFSQDGSFRNSTTREIIGDKEYYTKIMTRRVLFPQQTGTYKVGPTTVELGIADGDTPQRGFFYNSRLKPKNVRTNEATIRVRDLPPSVDPAFANAVGKYTMTSSINNRNFTTDDAITIKMEVTGNGDAKFVTPPEFLDANQFDIYDPNITYDESFDQRDGKIGHRKNFEYLFIPKKPGNYTIQPKFQYFDLDSNAYVTLKAGPFRVGVKQGVGNKDAALLEANPTEKLKPIRTTTSFHQKGSGFYKSSPYWILFSLGFLSMFITGGIHYKRKKSGNLDPLLIKREKAQKVALKKLEKAQEYLSGKEKSKFYEEIIRALKEYLSDKYNVPASFLSKANIESALQEKKIENKIIQDLVKLFNVCELNLYASGSADQMNDSFQDAKNLIMELE